MVSRSRSSCSTADELRDLPLQTEEPIRIFPPLRGDILPGLKTKCASSEETSVRIEDGLTQSFFELSRKDAQILLMSEYHASANEIYECSRTRNITASPRYIVQLFEKAESFALLEIEADILLEEPCRTKIISAVAGGLKARNPLWEKTFIHACDLLDETALGHLGDKRGQALLEGFVQLVLQHAAARPHDEIAFRDTLIHLMRVAEVGRRVSETSLNTPRKLSLLKAFYFRVRIIPDIDRVITAASTLLKYTFTPAALIAVFLVIGVSIFDGTLGTLLQTGYTRYPGLTDTAFLYATLLGLIAFHELGHAVACKKYGGRLQDMGIVFILLTPFVYINLSSAWGLKKRSQRIIVDLGGVYFEYVLLAALLVLVHCFREVPDQVITGIRFLALCIVGSIFLNLNPLVRFDGYYLLSDLLEIPNLRTKSFSYLKQVLRITSDRDHAAAELPKHQQVIFLFYAVSSLLFMIGYLLLMFVALSRLVFSQGWWR